MSKKAARPLKPFAIPLTFKPMEGLGGGFRMEWVTAKSDGVEAGLDSGSGLGNPDLTFWIEENGKRQYYTASAAQLLRDLVTLARRKR